MIGVTSREWVAAFYVILVIAIVAALGLRTVTVIVIASIGLLTYVASKACITGNYSYWRSLMLVASINLTGETLIGQIFVLPALAVASIFSWLLAITWILGARAWPRKRWLAFLTRYREIVLRVRLKD
jgi:hypothetical protein